MRPADPPTRAILVAPLAPQQADRAWALVRLVDPACGLEHWRAFLADWTTQVPPRGILAACNRRGVVVGLVPWWCQPEPGGQALWAGPGWIWEPVPDPRVAEAVTRSLSDHALATGCRSLYLLREGHVQALTPGGEGAVPGSVQSWAAALI